MNERKRLFSAPSFLVYLCWGSFCVVRSQAICIAYTDNEHTHTHTHIALPSSSRTKYIWRQFRSQRIVMRIHLRSINSGVSIFRATATCTQCVCVCSLVGLCECVYDTMIPLIFCLGFMHRPSPPLVGDMAERKKGAVQDFQSHK